MDGSIRGCELRMSMSEGSSNPGLRASDADRDVAVEQLRVAAMEGRIEADELEDRLERAYNARYCSELTDLTADVTVPAPVPPPGSAVESTSGPPTPPAFSHRMQDVNPFALAAIFSSLIWGVGSPLAIVFGHVALHQIDRSEGVQGGRNIALTGLAIGYAGTLVLFLFLRRLYFD